MEKYGIWLNFPYTYISIWIELPLVGCIEHIHNVWVLIASEVDDPISFLVVHENEQFKIAQDR